LATGSNIGDALKTGVVSGVTAGIGSSIGSAVAGAGSAADAAFIAADASQLAAQGLSEAAITQNLVATGVSQTVAQTAAQAALSGATEAAIAETLGPGTLFESTPAPIETATRVPAEQAAYPEVAVEQTYTPAPGSFQEALPGLGVETQASAAPFTAAPGSFAAATAPAAAGYGLLATPPSPALSLQDAFRGARLANSLLGEQPQQQPQRQDLPPMQATGVDLLTLPNLQARTANVAGLLSPLGVNMQPNFDLLSGQTLLSVPRQSLLG
jgi:hypothetical protein